MATANSKSQPAMRARSLVETAHLLLRVLDLEALKAGFTYEQAQVLLYLDANTDTDINPAILSREFFKEPHTIVGLLNRLENLGLTRRAAGFDVAHRNWVKVQLTKKGKEAVKLIGEDTAFDHLLTRIFADDDLEAIRQRCIDAFGEMTTRRYGVYARNVVQRRQKEATKKRR